MLIEKPREFPLPLPENFILRKGGKGRSDKKIINRVCLTVFFPAIIHCIRRGFQIYFAFSFLLPSHFLSVFRQKLELSVPPEVSCTPKFPTSNFSINFQNNRERKNVPRHTITCNLIFLDACILFETID